jgi:3-dehydroquinate synthase
MSYKISFKIDKTKLTFPKIFTKNFLVKSFPKSYEIIFKNSILSLKNDLKKKRTFLIVDLNIFKKYNSIFKSLNLNNIFLINSIEKNKTDKYTKKLIDFFVKNQITKNDSIFSVGGGIVQDISGYACLIYKRGIPWTYYPTTFLGMTDSCIGGKVGINYRNAKNLLALFSAPQKVIISTTFLKTLADKDLISGLGESLRLHITGGNFFVKKFIQNIEKCLIRNPKALLSTIKNSLNVKKLVVEKDEYEINIRRSMNFGHSFGHALEILCRYGIPHGTCIVIGMCIEVIVGYKNNDVPKNVRDTVLNLSLNLLNNINYYKILKKIKLDSINNILAKDKKTIGTKIFLALPKKIGNIQFIPKELNKNNVYNLQLAKNILLDKINEKYSFN